MAMITMVCISVVTTVLVIHVTAKSGPVPYLIQVLFLRILSRLTCMHHEELNHSPPSKKIIHNSATAECGFKLLEADSKPGNGKMTEIKADGNPEGDGMMGNNSNVNQNGAQIPNSIIEDLHFIRQDIEDRNTEEQTILQWKHVGRVLDRCLLVIFLVYTTFITLALIIRARGPKEHSH